MVLDLFMYILGDCLILGSCGSRFIHVHGYVSYTVYSNYRGIFVGGCVDN